MSKKVDPFEKRPFQVGDTYIHYCARCLCSQHFEWVQRNELNDGDIFRCPLTDHTIIVRD